MVPPGDQKTIRARIRIVNRLEELAQVVAEVETFGRQSNLPHAIVNDLNLALDEVLNNVISYAFLDSNSHAITIDLSCDGSVVTAEIADDGVAFNPLLTAPPTFEPGLQKRQIGGLGIHFVRNLMDLYHYSRTRKKNRLTLQKRLE